MGVLASIGTMVVLLGVCAMLINGGVVPEGAGEGCVLAACAVGCLVGGRLVTSDNVGGTLVWGILNGGFVIVALVVSGILLYGEMENGRCMAIGGACLCGGGLAGVLGGKKRRR